jgi:DnaK suppressor protein
MTQSRMSPEDRPALLEVRGQLSVPELRTALEEQWRHHVAEVVQLALEICDASPDDRDATTGDSALRVAARRIAAERLTLREIEAALERLDTGRYGSCEECSAAILPERLEVLPHTRYCNACQPRQRDHRSEVLRIG